MIGRARTPLGIMVPAALAVASVAAIGVSLVLGWGAWYLPVLGLVGAGGFWLSRRAAGGLATVGLTVASFVGGIILYAALGLVLFGLFYNFNQFDRNTGEGATAFKVWFWLVYVCHLVLTPLAAAGLARRVKRPVTPVAAAAAVAAALLAIPTLSWLAYFNNCIGMEFPFGRMSCD